MRIKQVSSFFLISLLSYTLLLGQQMEIPRTSPKAMISQTIGVCTVTLNYSRPSTRGREIIGKKVPYQQVWRAGANEATILSIDYPLTLGGTEVPPGKYGLFMIPDTKSWTLILNREWNQWGAYNYDSEKDVMRIEITPQEIEHTEMCTFTFTFTEVSKSSGLLNLEWEQTRISIPLETPTHQQTLQEIDQAVVATTQNWYVYSAAAQYHYYERKEAEKALEYINVAIALKAPNPAPWMLKSQILASQAQYSEAIQVAEAAIAVSRQHNFLFEVEENEANIRKWKDIRARK